MSRDKQSKREMRKNLDKSLEAIGLGADFMSRKEKKEFIKYVQDMAETIPPKDFHIFPRQEIKFAFSKDWEKVEMKLTDMRPNLQNMFANCRPLTDEETKEAIKAMSRDKQIEEIDSLTSVIYEANHKRSVLDYHWLATEVYNDGYRKASDVAEEIFAEVLSVVDKRIAEIEERYQRTSLYPTHSEYGFVCFLRNYFREIKTELEELKKKYTEGEKDDGNI